MRRLFFGLWVVGYATTAGAMETPEPTGLERALSCLLHSVIVCAPSPLGYQALRQDPRFSEYQGSLIPKQAAVQATPPKTSTMGTSPGESGYAPLSE